MESWEKINFQLDWGAIFSPTKCSILAISRMVSLMVKDFSFMKIKITIMDSGKIIKRMEKENFITTKV